MGDTADTNVLGLTAQIVAAQSRTIRSQPTRCRTLSGRFIARWQRPLRPQAKQTAEPVPAVPVERSPFPEFIVCLEDGKKLKMLKRHLEIRYNLSPADYRAKWDSPHDYPMVAPNYAITRSNLAKSIGLGRKSSIQTIEPEAIQSSEPDVTRMPARRARGSRG